MRAFLAILLLATSLGLPVGASSDVFHPVVCDEAIGCFAPEACAPGVFCPADPCDPAADCDAQLDAEPTTCAVNATIQGTTCVTYVGGGASAERNLVFQPLGNVGITSVDASVSLVQGDVQEFNLPNAWVSPVVEVEATAAGVDLGAFSVGAYRSEIIVPGDARFPEVTGEDHVYAQSTVELKKRGGQGGSLDLAVGIITLDQLPESCFVSSSTPLVPDFSCVRVSTVLP